MFDSLEVWIQGLADSFWVFPAMYLFASIDGFFPPIPSESAVIALAALGRSTGHPPLWLLIPVAAFGAFTGDQIAYQIGKSVNVRNLGFMRGEKGQKALDWAERSLAHRGASFIIAARYVPIGRVAVNMTAGTVHYPRRRFIGLTAIAGLSWAVYSSLIGIASGTLLKGHPVLAIVVGVVFGLVLGVVIDQVITRLSNRGGKADAPGDAATGAAADTEADVDVATDDAARTDPAPPA